MNKSVLAACAGVVLICFAAPAAQAGAARQAMKDGMKLYTEGRYEDAADMFREAAALAEKEGLDPAAAHYNRAAALIRARKGPEAAETLYEAVRAKDLELQGKAYYNRGNALSGSADTLEGKGDMDGAIRALDEALAMYENAMRLSPEDDDPKINFEVTSMRKARLEEEKKRQQENPQESQEKEDEEKDKQDDQPSGGDSQPQKEGPEEEKKQSRDPGEDQRQEESDPAGQDDQKGPEEAKIEREMTPDEARMLLDSMKQQEMSQRDQLRLRLGETVPVEKDW